MRLDLEHRGQTFANIHGSSILARSLQHSLSRRRQPPKVDTRALVAAVLGPHHGEDTQLRQGRLSPQHLDDAGVFISRKAVTFDSGGVERHF